jgi:phosphinothricin acetyltransferase
MASARSEELTIRPVEDKDADAVTQIYNHYITDTVVTFEEEPIVSTEMRRRFEEVATASLPWLVAERGGTLVGYAYATTWRVRRAYRFSTEVTIYLAPAQERRGIGSMLYTELLGLLRARGMHAAMGGIALPNAGSVALHEKLGFEKVAHFAEAGFKFKRWIDVGYWQLIL